MSKSTDTRDIGEEYDDDWIEAHRETIEKWADSDLTGNEFAQKLLEGRQ